MPHSNTLKYFQENAPEYAVATAGSLLGVAMSKGSSFPVGKVDFLKVDPISSLNFYLLTILSFLIIWKVLI
jgi:hypothetical protein